MKLKLQVRRLRRRLARPSDPLRRLVAGILLGVIVHLMASAIATYYHGASCKYFVGIFISCMGLHLVSCIVWYAVGLFDPKE